MKRYNMIMVIDSDNERILFCKRKKDPYAGKLNFPGGKWEEGETNEEAAYRELFEETGIRRESITPLSHLMDFIYYDSGRLVEIYVCCLTEPVKVVAEEGGNDLIWVKTNETDFGNNELFAGDGNILHCYLMARKKWEEFIPV